MMLSINPEMAKILGIYHIDDTVASNQNYDYKLEATWDEDVLCKLSNELTFENYDVGTTFHTTLQHEGIVFSGGDPEIIQKNSSLARTSTALKFSNNTTNYGVWNLYFHTPVRELQVFLNHNGVEVKIEGFTPSSSNPVVKDKTHNQDGILAIHSNQDIIVRIIGRNLSISRVHWEHESILRGTHSVLVCNAGKQPQLPLPSPIELEAVALPGMQKILPDGTDIWDLRAGLKWNIPRDENGVLEEDAPVSYHIKRKHPDGTETLVTQDAPLVVGVPNNPANTSDNPYYFIDSVEVSGEYSYQIAGVYLDGRTSPYCNYQTVLLQPPPPPPPTNVKAKYLDIKTYDSNSGTFSDPNLTSDEKAQLIAQNKSLIAIRCTWSENLRMQGPHATQFRIYFRLGWNNLISGNVLGVQPVPSPTQPNTTEYFVLTTDVDYPENTLQGEWMNNNKKTFKIISNTAGPNSAITVEKPPVPLDYQPIVGTFKLPISNSQESGGAGIDYNNSQNWVIDGKKLVEEIIIDSTSFPYTVIDTDHIYTIYIPADAHFPDPAFQTNPEEPDKVRYAQIGLTSYSSNFDLEGAVSIPATIIAVYREPPPAPDMVDLGLMATNADVYGKSSYGLRWKKPSRTDLKYDVYRAMDETLFALHESKSLDRW